MLVLLMVISFCCVKRGFMLYSKTPRTAKPFMSSGRSPPKPLRVCSDKFRYMADVSQLVDNICTLGEADLPPTHLHAHLELHFLSPVALLEALNKVHRTVRRHAVQIQQLTAQLNQIQVQLDRSREYAGDGE